jgi:hypothetical protein
MVGSSSSSSTSRKFFKRSCPQLLVGIKLYIPLKTDIWYFFCLEIRSRRKEWSWGIDNPKKHTRLAFYESANSISCLLTVVSPPAPISEPEMLGSPTDKDYIIVTLGQKIFRAKNSLFFRSGKYGGNSKKYSVRFGQTWFSLKIMICDWRAKFLKGHSILGKIIWCRKYRLSKFTVKIALLKMICGVDENF